MPFVVVVAQEVFQRRIMFVAKFWLT